ncbi:uncharacterized protein KY384_000500 [Bacidia gigantensis]|uniref:uncharacterized protein n=1 Tax=Bacidia gigantensis TaxID=2732470 RepID=UPI001D04182B|nr:uncharacterized protein KY384_000500 [Bacidia gigantensis]KAG8525740.1 hypothetical protein KY384_000500 [Bacidia gigantensis]
MSFGFAVGDFIKVGELAWRLYRDCYKVARDAPQEFQLLVAEISTMSNSLTILQEEVKDPESSLVQSGPDRVDIVNNMVGNIHNTLKALEKYAQKYDISGSGSTSKMRQRIKRFQWALHRKSIEELRSKMHQHNGYLTLLLTQAGNSSLQRIQDSTNTLEGDVQQIRILISSQQKRDDVLSPSLSLVEDSLVRSSLSARLLKNAEVSQPWSSIGVSQWIDTGRWWLQGSRLELYPVTQGGQVPISAYANLIKASWIVVDIIACHPQTSFLSGNTRAEIAGLCASVKNDFERIQSLGLQVPDLEEVGDQDLIIWENQIRAPNFRPQQAGLGNAPSLGNIWVVEGDERAFFLQRAICELQARSYPTMCDVVFLVQHDGSGARLVATPQNESAFMDIHFKNPVRFQKHTDCVTINSEKIMLKKEEDSRYLACLVDAANFYFFSRQRTSDSVATFQAYAVLFAVKNRHADLVELSKPKLTSATITDSSESSSRAIVVSHIIADKYLAGDIEGVPWDEHVHADDKIKLLSWAVHIGCDDLVRFLCAEGVKHEIDSSNELSPMMIVSYCGYESTAKILLAQYATSSKEIVDQNGKHRNNSIHYASYRGHDKIVRLLLRYGANINHTNDFRQTPLHQTAFHNQPKVAQLLLDKGANRNGKDSEQYNPVLAACDRGSNHVLPVFAEEDLDFIQKGERDVNALVVALSHNMRDRKPVTKEVWNLVFRKHFEQSELRPPPEWHNLYDLEHGGTWRRDLVHFEFDTDWAEIYLESILAWFEYPDGLPEFVSDLHQRMVSIGKPGSHKFFKIKFSFHVVHTGDHVWFSTGQGAAGTSGGSSTTLRVENGSQYNNWDRGYWRSYSGPQRVMTNPDLKASRVEVPPERIPQFIKETIDSELLPK